jgi:PAS domain S-box-containing protein
MYWNFTPFVIPLIVTSMVSVAIAVMAWLHQDTPGSKPFTLLMIAVATWSLEYAFELGLVGLADKTLWAKIQYFSIIAVPPAWLAFVLQYTGRSHWLNWKQITVLFIVPLLVTALVWTDSLHHLFFAKLEIISVPNATVLKRSFGPFFWFHTAYSYILMFLGFIYILQAFFDSPRIYHRQIGALIIAALIPWIGNILYVTGAISFALLDLTPFFLTITGAIVAWSVFSGRFMNLVPIAYRTAIKSMKDCLIILDDGNRILDVNPAAERIFGMKADALLGQNAEAAFQKLPGLMVSLKMKKDTDLQVVIPEAGHPQDYELRISPIFLQNRLNGRLLILNNITERKRNEEALRQSEAHSRALLNTIPDIIFQIQRNGTFTNFKGNTELLFTDPANFLNQKATDVLPKDVAELTIKNIEKTLSTGETSFFEYQLEVNKKLHHFECRMVAYAEDEILAIIRDISEWKQVAESMQQSEQRYRSLVENTMDGYFIFEIPSGKFLFLNQRICELFGYTMPEALNISIWDAISPEERDRVTKHIQSRVEGSRLNAETDIYTTIRKDNTTFRAEISTSLVTFEGKKAIQGILRDVTDRERFEKQLQHAQKMEAIGSLAGGVAHDLNNILTGLVGYPELLLMQLPEDSPMRKPLETIKKSGEKSAAIVQDLLNLARRGVENLEPANLNSIIEEYLQSPEFNKLERYHPKVTFSTEFDKNLLNIMGSSYHLAKMIMNLVSNAAEAMPNGGKILIKTENTYLDRAIIRREKIPEDEYAVLTVSDTGVGIPSEDIDRIFEPFYTKKKMGRSGTGLGMAVVWATVKDHTGYIDVISKVQEGTTFKVYLPISRQKIISKKEKLVIENIRGKGETILIVDDIEDQSKIAAEILHELGYNVKTVDSGEKAVEYLKKYTADLILLDMIMDPGMDGLETFKTIKKIHPQQKAIIVSGYSETDRVKEAMSLGAGQFLRKPFLVHKLGETVRLELDRSAETKT